MPAQFVDHILMRDEKDVNLAVQSFPAKKAIRISIQDGDGVGVICVPYELVPKMAQQLCAMVTRAGRVILAQDEQYPDY